MNAVTWYLGIDLGTGGLKVAAISRTGEVLASVFEEIETTLTSDGGSEQDPTQWWRLLVQSVRSLMSSGAVDRQSCRAVGITGQWGSTVAVDARGAALGPCLLWSDDRGGRYSKELLSARIDIAGLDPRKLLTWVRVSGGVPSVQGADPTGHALFLARERAEMVRRSAAFLEPVDFIGAQLTGTISATPASMIASWLTDNRVDAPIAYHHGLVRLSGRDPSKLPNLRPTGSVLGTLLPAVAAELGLAPSVRVVSGVPDLHTAALGSGAAQDFAGHVAISTSAWVSAPVPFKKTDGIRQMASVPGFAPGSYLIANNHETGGATLRWFRDEVVTGPMGLLGSLLPAEQPLTFASLSALAAKSAPGSGGVIFTPWLKGERSPVDDRNLRASFLNLSISSSGADLVRSVLEGVAYNARWLLEATESFAGRELSNLRMIGGGAQSDLWCQIHADVIGRTVLRVNDPVHVNVRGAAWFAAIGIGDLKLADLPAISPPTETFAPDPTLASVYRPSYREFVKLAKSQKGMFRRLNARG